MVAHTSGVVEDAALNVVATLAHTAVDNPKNDTVLPLGLIRKRGAPEPVSSSGFWSTK